MALANHLKNHEIIDVEVSELAEVRLKVGAHEASCYGRPREPT